MPGSGLEAWEIQKGYAGLLSLSPGSHGHPKLPTLLEGVAMQTVRHFGQRWIPWWGVGGACTAEKQDLANLHSCKH